MDFNGSQCGLDGCSMDVAWILMDLNAVWMPFEWMFDGVWRDLFNGV